MWFFRFLGKQSAYADTGTQEDLETSLQKESIERLWRAENVIFDEQMTDAEKVKALKHQFMN